MRDPRVDPMRGDGWQIGPREITVTCLSLDGSKVDYHCSNGFMSSNVPVEVWTAIIDFTGATVIHRAEEASNG